MMDARTVVSLSGTWDLAFDEKNVGKAQEWFARYPKKSVAAPVPGVWEQVRPKYDGVGWYRRAFEAPREWKQRCVRLRFGAAAYFAEVWLNGKYLGSHEGGYTPFEFDITRKFRPGANEVVVRIINPPIGRVLEGFRAGGPINQGDLPYGKGAWYFNFGGLWQDVELLVTDPVYVKDLYVQPHPFQKKAVLNVTVRNTGEPCRVRLVCQAASRGQEGAPAATKTVCARLARGDNQVVVPLRFSEVRLWSTDDPHLYVATVTVEGHKGPRDEFAVRFGMREFVIRGEAFLLNRKKVKMLGFLHQGMYPRTLCFPQTREFAERELRMVRQNGFNFLRTHLKPPNPWYLDLCDELGFLVEAEPPIGWIGKGEHMERRCRTEIEEMILRDRNHPSIVIWCLMNEAYHFRGFTMKEIKKITDRLGVRGRRRDNSRLLIDTSGGTGAHAEPDTKLLLPYSDATVSMMDVHGYCAMPLEDSSLVHYRTMGKAGVPLLNSEYGAPDVPPDYKRVLATYTPAERKLGLEDYLLHKDFYESLRDQFRKAGTARVFGSVDKMIPMIDRVRADEMRLITMAQRANPKLGGLALCQLADASGELFGALDVWRQPKQIWHGMVAAARTPLLVPEFLPRLLRPGEKATLRATLVNDDKIGPSYEWKAQIVSAAGKVFRTFAGQVRAEKEVQTVLLQKEKLDLTPGRYCLRCTLSGGGKEWSAECIEFTVLERAHCPVPRVGLWGPDEGVAANLARLGVKAEVFSNGFRDKNIPVLMDLRKGFPRRSLVQEYFGELKKIVQLGGCAVLFEPEPTQLFEWFFPTYIRIQGVMRLAGYVMPHPIFENLPQGCIVGYEYAELMPSNLDKSDDVAAAGGQVLFGGFSSHIWTRPACYFWAAGLYTVPIGRGQAIVCNLKVLDQAGKNPVADLLLSNLIQYAATVIQPGREDKLLTRCIDPLKPEDYA